MVKETICQCRRHKRCDFNPWVRKTPLEESMTTHSGILAMENPMDRGARWVIVHGVTKSRTGLKRCSTHAEVLVVAHGIFPCGGQASPQLWCMGSGVGWLSSPMVYRILVPQPRIKPPPPALEGRFLTSWTAREVPTLSFG